MWEIKNWNKSAKKCIACATLLVMIIRRFILDNDIILLMITEGALGFESLPAVL